MGVFLPTRWTQEDPFFFGSNQGIVSEPEIPCPQGWDGPYPSFGRSSGTKGGFFVVRVHSQSLTAAGNPWLMEDSDNSTELNRSYYFDLTDLVWKHFDGTNADDKTYTDGTPPTTPSGAYLCFPLDPNNRNEKDPKAITQYTSTEIYVRWGRDSASSGWSAMYDIAANTYDVRDSGANLVRYIQQTPSPQNSGEHQAVCRAGDGNLYAFHGVRDTDGGAVNGVYQFNPDFTTTGNKWTLMENTDWSAVVGDRRRHEFAVELDDGRVWFGGGETGAGTATYETWYYDYNQSAGSRLTLGPSMPSSGTNVWRKPIIAKLTDGTVYCANGSLGAFNTYRFDPSTDTFTDGATSGCSDPPVAINDNPDTPGMASFGLPDGRVFITTDDEGTYISTHT